MTNWIKVYNSMPSHPKIVMAGDRAAWLAVCGLCYSNEHLTDGFIARHALPIVAPGVKGAERLAERLEFVGAWLKVDGGWQINDYLEHQRSADEVRERRKRDAERKAAHRSGGSPKGSPRGQIAESTPESSPLEVEVEVEKRREEQHVAATPPLNEADRELNDQVNSLASLLSAEVRAAHGIDAKSKEARPVKGWHDAARAMLTIDGYTSDQIDFAIRWVCRHHYWSRRVRSMPRLRSEMAQIVKEIREQRGHGNQANVVPFGRRTSPSDLIRQLIDSEESA